MTAEPGPDEADGSIRCRRSLQTDRPADHFTPRAAPAHPSARIPLECPLVRWPP